MSCVLSLKEKLVDVLSTMRWLVCVGRRRWWARKRRLGVWGAARGVGGAALRAKGSPGADPPSAQLHFNHRLHYQSSPAANSTLPMRPSYTLLLLFLYCSYLMLIHFFAEIESRLNRNPVCTVHTGVVLPADPLQLDCSSVTFCK